MQKIAVLNHTREFRQFLFNVRNLKARHRTVKQSRNVWMLARPFFIPQIVWTAVRSGSFAFGSCDEQIITDARHSTGIPVCGNKAVRGLNWKIRWSCGPVLEPRSEERRVGKECR